jgi:hypothetical protein
MDCSHREVGKLACGLTRRTFMGDDHSRGDPDPEAHGRRQRRRTRVFLQAFLQVLN